LTAKGRERAKARGVKMGRKPMLTAHQESEAIKRRNNGERTLGAIGRSLQCERQDDFEAAVLDILKSIIPVIAALVGVSVGAF
jgi:hypothetical protein